MTKKIVGWAIIILFAAVVLIAIAYAVGWLFLLIAAVIALCGIGLAKLLAKAVEWVSKE